MTSAIRRIESIRLSDMPRSASRSDGIPAGSALSKAAEVHVTFVTSYDPSHSFLSPFNIHRQVLGVLGLATCSSAQSVEMLEQAPAALRQLHPSAVVHRVFGFDVGATRPQTMDLSSMTGAREAIERAGAGITAPVEGQEGGDMGEEGLRRKKHAESSGDAASQAESSRQSGTSNSGFSGRGPTGLVIFPAVRRDLKDVRFYLKTLIPNFIGDVLDGLDAFVKDLHGKPLETPRETLEGAMATSTSSNASRSLGANVGAAASSAASRASALFSSFSSDETSNRKVSRSGKNIQSLSAVGPTGSGRYAKVKADYYLLVGDLWGALQTYDSCMGQLGKERALAGGQDAVWYASALEGWAVARTLTARMGGLVEERAPCATLPLGGIKEKEKDKVVIEFQYSGKEWSDIAEAYSLALTVYSKCLAPASYLLDTIRSVNPDTPRDYTHPLIHASACLAYSRLLLAIWASGGWNGETFDQLLLGGVPPALAETTRPTLAVYTQHTTASGIHRNEIASPASQSMTNSSTNALKMLDQIHLYSSLAAIYGCIGFARKETYAIQRLQALVSLLIAQGIHLQKQLGSSSSQALRAGDAAHGTMATHISSVGGGHGSDSILVLALQICQTYGINVQVIPLLDMDKGHILLRASVDAKSGQRLSSPMLNRSRAGWSMSLSSPTQAADWQRFATDDAQARVAAISELLEEPPFGWIEQQILILKDTIAICEMLQDKEALLFFALLLLRDFWAHLGFEDQFKLKDGIAKIMAEIEGKEKDSMLQYWGPKDILGGIELESGASSAPYKVSFQDIVHESEADTAPDWSKRRDRRSVQPVEDMLVEDEMASFAVTLHNPLAIPLELESIRLELATVGSLGATFEAIERKNVILPPSSLHVVRLGGVSRGEGRLCVRGVHIKLPFCAERMFTFEYARGVAEKTLWKAEGDLDDRWTRTKRFGLDARGSGSTGQGLHSLMPKSRSRMQESLWILPVIAKVPLIDIKPSSALRSGSVVLFDGEERIMTLTLQNRGDMNVDYLRFSFEDDVQNDIVALLAEGQLEGADVYELEQDLLQRPFLSLASDEDGPDAHDLSAPSKRVIDAGGSQTFTFRIRGKLDVRRATIRLQFGNKYKSRELGREYFWVRRASFSFDVRVLPTIFLDGLEIVPAQEEEVAMILGRDAAAKSFADKLKHGAALISLAAHNAHPGEVKVTLSIEGALSSEGEGIVTRKLAAQALVRLHFILPRLGITGLRKWLDQPIPKLVERQFILSKIQRTAQEERQMRACFWARQAMLDRVVQSNWTDTKTGQTGAIGMTGVRIEDPQAVLSLYGEPLQVAVNLSDGLTKPAKGAEVAGTEGILQTRAHDFVELRFDIKNLTDVPIRARYRLASGIDEKQLSQHVLCISGHTQGHVCPTGSIERTLAPDDSTTVFVGLCFLTRGSFPFTLLILPEPDDEGAAALVWLNAHAALARKGIKVHVH